MQYRPEIWIFTNSIILKMDKQDNLLVKKAEQYAANRLVNHLLRDAFIAGAQWQKKQGDKVNEQQIETPAMVLIKKFYKVPEIGDKKIFMLPSEILQEVQDMGCVTDDDINCQTIGLALRALSFKRVARQTYNGPRYGYMISTIK
jgi:hypothetical protein